MRRTTRRPFQLSAIAVGALLWANTAAASFGVGAQVQTLMPDDLNGFRSSLLVYGPVAVLSLESHAIQLQLSQGSADAVTAYFAELTYRYDIETPFFTFFLAAGAEYLHHSLTGNPGYDNVGAHVGPGLLLKFGKTVNVPLNLRIHFLRQPLVAAGGALIFTL